MTFALDLQKAARLSPNCPRGPWRSIGCEVWSGRNVIGRMQSPTAAEVVALAFNVLVPAWNHLLTLEKEVQGLQVLLEVKRHE